MNNLKKTNKEECCEGEVCMHDCAHICCKCQCKSCHSPEEKDYKMDLVEKNAEEWFKRNTAPPPEIKEINIKGGGSGWEPKDDNPYEAKYPPTFSGGGNVEVSVTPVEDKVEANYVDSRTPEERANEPETTTTTATFDSISYGKPLTDYLKKTNKCKNCNQDLDKPNMDCSMRNFCHSPEEKSDEELAKVCCAFKYRLSCDKHNPHEMRDGILSSDYTPSPEIKEDEELLSLVDLEKIFKLKKGEKTNKDKVESWEERFDKRWNFHGDFQNKPVFTSIKSFIKKVHADTRANTIKEIKEKAEGMKPNDYDGTWKAGWYTAKELFINSLKEEK